MNKVILMGNLTRDPELRVIPNSQHSVCNFGVAMNERWTDAATGEQKENVTFVDVEAWNRQGEIIAEHFTKGKAILVEGSLKFEQWKADDGTNRNRLKVRLQRFEFVGPNPNGNGNGAQAAAPTTGTPSPTTETGEAGDDVPF